MYSYFTYENVLDPRCALYYYYIVLCSIYCYYLKNVIMTISYIVICMHISKTGECDFFFI